MLHNVLDYLASDNGDTIFFVCYLQNANIKHLSLFTLYSSITSLGVNDSEIHIGGYQKVGQWCLILSFVCSFVPVGKCLVCLPLVIFVGCYGKN